MDATTIVKSDTFANIISSRNGAFAITVLAVVALYGIHEFYSKVELGMEKGYNVSISSEKLGNIGFTKNEETSAA